VGVGGFLACLAGDFATVFFTGGFLDAAITVGAIALGFLFFNEAVLPATFKTDFFGCFWLAFEILLLDFAFDFALDLAMYRLKKVKNLKPK
jgi:hypothetical protein